VYLNDVFVNVAVGEFNDSKIWTPITTGSSLGLFTADFLYQTAFQWEFYDPVKCVIGMCDQFNADLSTTRGQYFYYDGTDWRCRLVTAFTTITSDPIPLVNAEDTIIRIQNFGSERVLRYYVNGLVVFEVDTSALAGYFAYASYLTYRIKGVPADINFIDIFQLYYSYHI
jgi:hypothetical protein